MIDAGKKRHIVIFACITALCLVGDSMLYVVLPVHYAEAGLSSLWEVGVILAVNRIVRLPLNPCIGWLYSHVSERAGILVAVALATATTLSYGFLPGFAFWIVARCVWGVAWTLLRLGSLFCILNLSEPHNRGHYTGLYTGLYRLGSLVGMLAGGILADLAGIRTTAVIFGGLTALALFLALFLFPRNMDRAEACSPVDSLAASLTAAVRDGNVLRVVVAGTLIALVFQGAVTSTLSRLIDVHTGGGVALAGFCIGASTLSGAFQALRWGWEPWLAPFAGRISDRPGGRPALLCRAFGAGAAALALLALALPLPLWFGCLLGMQLTATALVTVADAAASDAAASIGGRSMLMGYALLVDVGAAFGPLIAYGVNEFFGINTVYALNAALFAVLFFVWKPHAGTKVR